MINRDSRSGSLPPPGSGSASHCTSHTRSWVASAPRTRAITEPVPVHLGGTDAQRNRCSKILGRAPTHRVHDRDRRKPRGAPARAPLPSIPRPLPPPKPGGIRRQVQAAQDTRTRAARHTHPLRAHSAPARAPGAARAGGKHPAPQVRGAPDLHLASPSRDPYRTHAAHESRREKASTTAQQPSNQQHAIRARPAALTR